MRTTLAALATLAVASHAEAKCRLPALELLWSYPAAGASDVPVNTELWFVAPYAWWNPVVRLDGQELAYTPSLDARGLVHVLPGLLLPNHDYVVELDYTGVRAGEDAGVNARMEVRFRTGTATAGAPAAPELGAHTASAPLTFMPDVVGSCPEVIRAQDCWDTGPNMLHTFAVSGQPPLAWLVGPHVLPARCEVPQVLAHVNRVGGQCFEVRAMGEGGLLSAPTQACVPREALSPDAGAEVDVDEDAPDEDAPNAGTPERAPTAEEGCNLAPAAGGWWLLALLGWRRTRRKAG